MMTNATMVQRAEAAGRNFNAKLQMVVSAKLGCEVRLDHYETDAKGWPVPVFAVPFPQMDAARSLGLTVMEWDIAELGR